MNPRPVTVATSKPGPKILMLSNFTLLASLCDVIALAIELKRPPPVPGVLVEVLRVLPKVVAGVIVVPVAAEAGVFTLTDTVEAAAPVGIGAPSYASLDRTGYKRLGKTYTGG
jgi:hypothetical protein